MVTNLSEIPSEYDDILKKNDIKIIRVGFDSFVFPDDYRWSLAFYKLCALKAVTNMSYDYICYMDSDVYVQGSFKYVWFECKQNILMYDISIGIDESYCKFYDEIEQFIGHKKLVTHYGGEFFAANKENAISFSNKCIEVYQKLIKDKYVQNAGDEFILSVAALDFKTRIKNAGLFVFRFWTGSSFRFICSVYKMCPVVVLHVPAEKERGMIKVYEKFIKQGKLPSDKSAWKMFRISKLSPWEYGKHCVATILRRIRTKR